MFVFLATTLTFINGFSDLFCGDFSRLLLHDENRKYSVRFNLYFFNIYTNYFSISRTLNKAMTIYPNKLAVAKQFRSIKLAEANSS